jgi:integrase
MWDVDTVLHYLRERPLMENLTLLQLSCKVIMLLALVSGQRGQSLHLLKVRDLQFFKDQLIIQFSACLKTTKPGHHQQCLDVHKFVDSKLCVVSHLEKYVEITKTLRQEDCERLFITSVPPHNAVARDTISRWIKMTMADAGIDVQKFRPHSTRSASTSAAVRVGVPLDNVLSAAGWSSDCAFRKFYNKPLVAAGTVPALTEILQHTSDN